MDVGEREGKKIVTHTPYNDETWHSYILPKEDWHCRYDLDVLQQCGKRVKTKSQKVLGAKSYVCRSYRGKTGGGSF